jgi:Mrp family chromosome partitioning ATPase
VLPAAALAGSKRRFGRSGAMDPGQQSLGIAGLALRRMFELDPMIPHDSSMVRSLLVTSAPQDAEARRRACRLFASAAAMRGQRVLLIDADLAHPSRQEAAGLLDVLRGDCKLDAAVDIAQPPEVSLLDRGRERSGAFDNDGRGFARRMFTEARPLFDLAVIDGGALIENLRVAPLVTTADEVLLVAQLGISSQNAALAAAESASVMGRPVTAVMLFDAPV